MLKFMEIEKSSPYDFFIFPPRKPAGGLKRLLAGVLVGPTRQKSLEINLSLIDGVVKVSGWLSKNFDIQGVVCFCERGYTYGMPSEQKCATTQ